MFQEAVRFFDEVLVSLQNGVVKFATYNEEGVTHVEARRAPAESRYSQCCPWIAYLHQEAKRRGGEGRMRIRTAVGPLTSEGFMSHDRIHFARTDISCDARDAWRNTEQSS